MNNNNNILKSDYKNNKINQTIPTVVEDVILSYIDHPEVISNSMNYSPWLTGDSFFENRLPVFTLLQHAVRGEYKEVNNMLAKNPLLLLERDSVTDYSNRKHFKRTVYQIALGACDYNIKDVNEKIVQHGMVEMIEHHFMRLPGKSIDEINEIMQLQIQEQYPESYRQCEENLISHHSNVLHDLSDLLLKTNNDLCMKIKNLDNDIYFIINNEISKRASELKKITYALIRADSDDDFEFSFKEFKNILISSSLIDKDIDIELLKGVYYFRYTLEPNKTPTIGKHFNDNLLLEATQLFENTFKNFDIKNQFFLEKVIGYMQRFLPACHAQCVAQGLWNIIKNGEDSERSLKFKTDGSSYFPLNSDPNFELGYHCSCLHPNEVLMQASEGSISQILSMYLTQKNQQMEVKLNTMSKRIGKNQI